MKFQEVVHRFPRNAVDLLSHPLLLFTLAGQGTLYQTQVSAGGLNVTAYAVKNQAGGMSVVVINKDTAQNLQLTMSLPQEANTASLVALTQLPAANATSSTAAASSISIQNGTVDTNGNFAPSAAYNLAVTGSQVTCYVPAFSAILIEIA